MPRARILAWAVGLIALVVLTVVAFWDYYPPLPERQQLTLVFDAPAAGRSDPLIVTGHWGVAEFIYVKYIDEHTAVFGYDAWGLGGPTSQPIPIVRGQRYTLDVQFPALALVVGSTEQVSDRVRVRFDGVTMLDTPAVNRQRRPQRVWFGQNPAGGSSCGREFQGRILRADGRSLCGSVREIFTRTERIGAWLTYGRWQMLAVACASALVAWGWSRLEFRRWRSFRAADAWRAHGVFIITAVGCIAAFAVLVNWPAAWPPYPNRWGAFYDYQALSFLQGRLDVPADAIYSEAFYFRGKIYGYFGPTPALLRMPL